MRTKQAAAEDVLGAHLAFAAAQQELSRTFARNNGLHLTDSIAIVAIIRAEQDGEPLTPARLAETIALSAGATSILLNRLEAVGHVTRTRGHADRRKVTLHSTPVVNDLAAAFFDPLRRDVEVAMSAYPAEVIAASQQITAALTEVFAQHEPEATGAR